MSFSGDNSAKQKSAGGMQRPGRPLQKVPGKVEIDQSAVRAVPRDVPDEHPAHRRGQSGLPAQHAAHQLLQEEKSGRNHRRNTTVPEPALLLQRGTENQGKRVWSNTGFMLEASDVVCIAILLFWCHSGIGMWVFIVCNSLPHCRTKNHGKYDLK